VLGCEKRGDSINWFEVRGSRFRVSGFVNFVFMEEGISILFLLEWVVLVTALAYVIFAAHKHIITWLFALLSTGITFFLDVYANLYIEAGLQVFYFAMALVGWIEWNRAKSKSALHFPEELLDAKKTTSSFVQRWPLKYHLLNILFSGILTVVLAEIFIAFTDQSTPYLDAFTTCFSLLATWMVVKRVLENWIYWVVIDAALVVLYLNSGYSVIALQYAIFTGLAIYGYFSWHKTYKQQCA
jgi:nicotinamide mononucleotide transporter